MKDMGMNCPLPVDLLDYLAGSSPEVDEHIQDCMGCRQALARLAPIQSAQIDTSKVIGIPIRAWIPEARTQSAVGDIWMSAHEFVRGTFEYSGLDALPFLVLSEQREDENGRWVDAVPIWPDVENASFTDLILNAADTTLSGSFRTVFDLQMPIEIDQFAGHIGSLTESGLQVLQQLFDGELGEDNFGPRLESDGDPRLEATEWIRQIAREVGSYYAYCHARSSERVGVAASQLHVLGTFQLSDVERAPFGQSRLLAARTVPGLLVRKASLVTGKGVQLEARLSYHIDAGDVLRFEVTGAIGIHHAIRVVAISGLLQVRAVSEPFVPNLGTSVDFARGQGMLLKMVDSLELEQ